MPTNKFTIGNVIAICVLVLMLLAAAISGVVAYGDVCARMACNELRTQRIESDIKGLVPAVKNLEITIAALTQQLKSHQPADHIKDSK